METSTRDIFAKNLRRFADEKHLAQTDIATLVDCSTATVSDWFNGKKYPRPNRMQRIADILGVKMSDLITEHSLPSGAAPEAEALELFEQHYGKEASCAVSKYLRLDNPDRTLVSSMMDTMLEQDKYSIQEKSKHA